jgi:hypothetical protein
MKYLDPNVTKSLSEKAVPHKTKYDRNGSPVINDNEAVYAEELTQNNKSYYQIKTYQNVPFDPQGQFSHREKHLETSMKKVSKETFDYYMLFLKTRNGLYMTRAQRSFIND